jgi:HAD superfamily hydrolase (TIGR01450 family)
VITTSTGEVLQTRPSRLYDAYVFDLDGTIYLGDQLLPGVASTVGILRARGIPVRFLSNNPTKDPGQYAAKLGALGLPTSVGDIANTVITTVGWLSLHRPDAVVFPIAEEPLVRALLGAGFRLSDDPAEIDVVVASYDRNFDYRKLQIAFDALWLHKRAILVQTNPDRYCPFPGGRGEPDCAAITAAIEVCTQVRCSMSFGKPDPIMATQALHGLGVPPEDVLMVGDRLATDIAMGRAAGMATAMVLTGDSTRADAAARPASERPDFFLPTLDYLLPAAHLGGEALQDVGRRREVRSRR